MIMRRGKDGWWRAEGDAILLNDATLDAWIGMGIALKIQRTVALVFDSLTETQAEARPSRTN